MEKKQFKFGHETGVIIIFGLIVSFTIKALDESGEFVKELEFNKEIFFEVLLPLIIFATGFNLRRQQFFENFSNISKFGLIGTFITFIIYSVLTWQVLANIPITKHCPKPELCGNKETDIMVL